MVSSHRMTQVYIDKLGSHIIAGKQIKNKGKTNKHTSHPPTQSNQWKPDSYLSVINSHSHNLSDNFFN